MSNPIARWTAERWLGAIIVAMSMITIIIVAVQTERLSDATECQAEYNDAYTKGIQQRASAARSERQAQRTYLNALLNGATTEAEARDATDEYLASLDRADRTREAAAIPTRKC
jgi:hypothetical protein